MTIINKQKWLVKYKSPQNNSKQNLQKWEHVDEKDVLHSQNQVQKFITANICQDIYLSVFKYKIVMATWQILQPKPDNTDAKNYENK